MKQWLQLLCALAALLACLLLLRRSHRPDLSPTPPSQDAAVQAALNRAGSDAVAAIDSAFAPAPSAVDAAVRQTVVPVPPMTPTAALFTNLPPTTVMENVRRALRDYASRFNGNPVGTNPEIARALAGDNPRQVNFLNEETGVRLNDKGELVDPWGVPFFLHQLSAYEMEIRSAGPDRRMWTSDDLVTR